MASRTELRLLSVCRQMSPSINLCPGAYRPARSPFLMAKMTDSTTEAGAASEIAVTVFGDDRDGSELGMKLTEDRTETASGERTVRSLY